jgi:hypothetical protein
MQSGQEEYAKHENLLFQRILDDFMFKCSFSCVVCI